MSSHLFDLRERQKLNHGFGDGMSRAFEMAITPVLFGFFGWLIDRALGTSPWFTIGLAVFAVCGMFAKTWITYEADMKAHEAELPSNRKAKAAS